MVRSMKPRSVIMDVSIDEGGCVETSRPTTHEQPVYIEENIVHYCVPNITGAVARTATHVFVNAAMTYILEIANKGAEGAIATNPDIAIAVNTHAGTDAASFAPDDWKREVIMDWKSIYESRLCSAEEAVRAIKSDNRIFMTGNVSVPQKLLAALVDYAPEVAKCGNLPGAFGCPKRLRKAGDGRAPAGQYAFHQCQRPQGGAGGSRRFYTGPAFGIYPAYSRIGILPVDVAMIHVSPPDEHGFCSLGVEVGLSKSPAESAKIIIAEVNEQMPRTLGDAFIHVSRISHMVPVNYPVAELPQGGEGDEISEKIAGYIAELIPDGATMQMGIGAIPDAVLNYLEHEERPRYSQ